MKETKRKAIPKKVREQVYEKCNGHCAYCGCEITYKQMQVDHVKPLRIGGNNSIENMLPACRSCNHYKSTLDVEGFREYLGEIAHRLMRDSIPFRVATRFGIVKHMYDDVVFYFEREVHQCGNCRFYNGGMGDTKQFCDELEVFTLDSALGCNCFENKEQEIE